MKTKRILSFLRTCLVLTTLVCPSIVAAQGDSPSSPAPTGKPFLTMIECGEGYTSQELYDMKITLVGGFAGEEGVGPLKRGNPIQQPPEDWIRLHSCPGQIRVFCKRLPAGVQLRVKT